MRFYIWFENFLDLILRMLWVLVVWIHEIRNIRKKKILFSDVQLKPDQIEQVDKLWQQAYGKRISKDWNRLYQSYTGQFDAKYFPEILYTTKLEPLMNPRHVCRVLSDKNLLAILFKDDEVKVPRTIVSNAWGYIYDGSYSVISEEKMIEILKDAGNIVIKPTVNSNSGKGITMHNIQNGIDLLSGESVSRIISKLNKNYIIQEKLAAHSDYARLYDKSINTVRVITYIVDNSVHHA
ncbi:MAG: sugar-transfer associated ATP-grasp domain-containing protein, partial [Syntrophomonas sp.]